MARRSMLLMLRYYIFTPKKKHQRISRVKVLLFLMKLRLASKQGIQEVSDVSTLIERKINDLSDKVEKRLHST